MDDRFEVQQIIDELLPDRLERLRKSTGVPVVLGGAALHGREGGAQLVLDRLVGTQGDSLRGLVVQSGKGLGGCVLRLRTPLRVQDYATTMAITHDYVQVVREERLTSVFAVPVLIRGEVRSVLYGAVRGRRPIDDRTLRAAVAVAAQFQRDVEERLRRGPDAPDRRFRDALSELAAVIRETGDPGLRARLVGIQSLLVGASVRTEVIQRLAPREIDVLRLVEVGARNRQIAAQLGLSLETVKAYLRSAMRKLEVHTRTAAAHRARVHGML
jgi:LuxR family transcriptional regulator, regulator of acetate metabolism